MTLRASMASLISTLRGFCNAGTADYSIASTDYWSDAQLQSVLDRYRADIREAELTAHPIKNGSGVIEYKEYTTPLRWMESTAEDGTERFIITEVDGTVISSDDYTADYESGLIVFDSDQEGAVRYLTCHAFDIYAAAADVWEQKGAAYATQIDFSTDGHNIKRSHIVAQCEAMAKRYRGMASSGSTSSVQVIRGDANYD